MAELILEVDVEIDNQMISIEVEIDESDIEGMTEEEIEIHAHNEIMEYIKNNVQLDYNVKNLKG